MTTQKRGGVLTGTEQLIVLVRFFVKEIQESGHIFLLLSELRRRLRSHLKAFPPGTPSGSKNSPVYTQKSNRLAWFNSMFWTACHERDKSRGPVKKASSVWHSQDYFRSYMARYFSCPAASRSTTNQPLPGLARAILPSRLEIAKVAQGKRTAS